MITAQENGTTEMQATDMELGLRLSVDAKVERPGTVLVPGRLMLDVARSLPSTTATLELREQEQALHVEAERTTFDLRTLRVDDFPPLAERGEEGGHALPVAAFADTIARVARCASRDETRPILTGILVSVAGKELRMVATDSYRLSVKETALEKAVAEPFEANVPARALQELVRLAQQSEAETLTAVVRRNQIVFELDAAVLSSRLIEGQFPNYRQLLPDTSEHELHVAREELLEVVRRVSLMAQRNAPLRLSFAPGELTVLGRTPDVGEAREALPIPFAGEPMEIGFNPEFLRDGLESTEADEVVLKLTTALRPGVIEAGDGSGFTYLVMPIRLNV